MNHTEVLKSYTPSFFAGIMTAILIAIILGQNPLNRGGWELMILLMLTLILFCAGLIFSLVVLSWIK
jgi:hypothetical protein